MPIGFKNLNSFISILSKIVYYAMFLYIAVICSDLFWWLFTPTNPKIDYNPVSIHTFDNAEKFIVNRSPFGLVVESKKNVEVKPTIASLIKITGLYVNDERNSFVFYQLNGKNNLAKIGDKLDNAVIKSINSNGIVITEDGNDFNVDLLHEDNSNKNSSNKNSINKNSSNYYYAGNDNKSQTNNEASRKNQFNQSNLNSTTSNTSSTIASSTSNNKAIIDNGNMDNNLNKNKENEEDFNRKKEQLIQEFVNGKESKSK